MQRKFYPGFIRRYFVPLLLTFLLFGCGSGSEQSRHQAASENGVSQTVKMEEEAGTPVSLTEEIAEQAAPAEVSQKKEAESKPAAQPSAAPESARKSRSQQEQNMHRLRFGFNIGHLTYLNNKRALQPVFDRLKQDGYDLLRIYEPFRLNLPNFVITPAELLEFPINQGFEVLLSISNYPYQPNQDRELQWLDSLRKVPLYKENIQSKIPGYGAELSKMAKNTNRFPPLDLAWWRNFMKTFLAELNSRGLLSKMKFELGNEPNAGKYSWGTASEFAGAAEVARQEIAAMNRPVYCCGFTGTQIYEGNEFRIDFKEMMDRHPMFTQNKVKLSFHHYLVNQKGDDKNADLFDGKVPPGSAITETNIFAFVREKDVQKQEYMASDAFLYHLAKLALTCYTNKVEEVYFFWLKDFPAQDSRLGIFDLQGNPKPQYLLLNRLQEVIGAGYRAEQKNGKIILTGTNKIMEVALQPVQVSIGAERVVARSGNKTTGALDAGDWIIYNR